MPRHTGSDGFSDSIPGICDKCFSSIQESVHVGGITIHPGDLLHGDRNGVTTVPLEIASEIPEACEVFVKAEGIIIEYLHGDRVTLEGFGESKSEAGKMIDELRQRVALKANKE